MFPGKTQILATNVSYSPYSRRPSSTILPISPIFEVSKYSPIFWRINRTPIPVSFEMSGSPVMINQNYLFLIFGITNKASNNKNI